MLRIVATKIGVSQSFVGHVNPGREAIRATDLRPIMKRRRPHRIPRHAQREQHPGQQRAPAHENQSYTAFQPRRSLRRPDGAARGHVLVDDLVDARNQQHEC